MAEQPTLKELKAEAKDLGIEFSANIGMVKLQEKINEYYAIQNEMKQEAPPEPATNQERRKQGINEIQQALDEKANAKLTLRQRAKIAEKLARKTHVVEIIDNDPRVNAYTTTVTVSCGNEYFDLGSRIIPLNTPVELEQGYIDSLKEVEFPFHQLDQKSGLSNYVIRKRYTISYTGQTAE